jgi:hypothetical protein
MPTSPDNDFPVSEKKQLERSETNCLHSPDVISFARKHGFITVQTKRSVFSDVYNPLNFGAPFLRCPGLVVLPENQQRDPR